MSALARWCARWRFAVLALWIVALLGLAVGVVGAGAAFTDSVNLPDSESNTAYKLLAQAGMGTASADGGGTDARNIVWHTEGASVDDPAVQTRVTKALAEIGDLPGVESVVSPYDAAGAAQLNVDENTAYAALTVNADADLEEITAVADSLDGSGLQVVAGGRAFTEQPAAGGVTEILGVLGALVILLLVFRSLWAAVLPIITGIAGVGVSALLVMLASHVVDLPSQTTALGALIGLGVGIDYALFIVNRHRKALLSGASVTDSLTQAVNTSGRAVLFAGGTVIIGLLGLLVLRVGILSGMAQGAALTVLITVGAAVTLLPALLAMMGTRVLSRKQRRALAADGSVAEPEGGMWTRWSLTVQRRPKLVGVVAAALIVVLAIPALSIRLGSADASSDPEGSPTNTYYTLMADGFGEGFDAPLVLVGSTPDVGAQQAFTALGDRLGSVSDVAAVSTVPATAGQQVGVITVVPGTSAQTQETADLVTTLREDVVPDAERGTDLQVYVGGTTASNIDFAETLTSKLPVFLVIIALLGFVLLAIAFRSLLVPLIGAIANLLTMAIALGAVTAIFQWGWGARLLGVGGAAPIEPITPILIVGVIFGLAMDYQVFLVSRMHEEWGATRDNRRAVRVGMAQTGRVIATAAAIMLCVFASFGLAGERIISQLGIGLAVAVLVDAFVLRMALTPAVMHLIGKNNWWYPRWAERITPNLSVEGPGGHEPLDDLPRGAQTPVTSGQQ